MPILHNAKKALRSSKKKAKVNQQVKSKIKTAVDKVKKEKNPTDLKQAYSQIDKAVKKHIIHKNKAARMKSAAAKLFGKKK